MKIRIKGNSLRLRLTKSEVAQFEQDGLVEESIHFSPEQAMTYAIQRAGIPTITASYSANRMLLQIPEQQGNEWASSDLVGLSHRQTIGNGEELQLLIEKDFHCMTPRAEEDGSDHYPNPLAQEK